MYLFGDEENTKTIAKMANDTGLTGTQAVMDAALIFFKWAIEEVREGNSIASVNEQEKTYQVLAGIKALEHVAANRDIGIAEINEAELEKKYETRRMLSELGLKTDVQVARKMMSDTGLQDAGNLLNNALTLFGWAIESVDKGCIIGAITKEEDNYRELDMPALKHVAATKDIRNEERQARSFVDRLEEEYRQSSLSRAIADLDPDNDRNKSGKTH